MKHLLFATIIIVTISCKQTQQKQKAVSNPDFDMEFSLDTSIKFQNARDAAYGYNLLYPKTFIEQIDTIGQVDSIVFYSPDQQAKVKFFVEGETPKNKNTEDRTEQAYFKKYFDSLINNNHRLTQKTNIIKTSYSYKNYEYGRPAKFIMLGERQTTEFLFKTELSEVPINGELTFKCFLMEYPKDKKVYYRPIALNIAKNFGQ